MSRIAQVIKNTPYPIRDSKFKANSFFLYIKKKKLKIIFGWLQKQQGIFSQLSIETWIFSFNN